MDENISFIVRKVDQNVFEIEASPKYDPILMFAIGISEIVGPYIDYFNEINDAIYLFNFLFNNYNMLAMKKPELFFYKKIK